MLTDNSNEATFLVDNHSFQNQCTCMPQTLKTCIPIVAIIIVTNHCCFTNFKKQKQWLYQMFRLLGAFHFKYQHHNNSRTTFNMLMLLTTVFWTAAYIMDWKHFEQMKLDKGMFMTYYTIILTSFHHLTRVFINSKQVIQQIFISTNMWMQCLCRDSGHLELI